MEKVIRAIVVVKLKRIYSGIVWFGQRLEYDYCLKLKNFDSIVIVE